MTPPSLPRASGDRPIAFFAHFSRRQLALYAGGSGDHNPLHIDSDVARSLGFDDVIVPGMLLMAQVGRLLTDWAGPGSIRTWSVRFIAITPVCARVTVSADLVGTESYDGEPCCRLAVRVAADGVGEVLRGEAIVVPPPAFHTGRIE